MCLFVFVLNVPEKGWKVSSLKYHSVLLLLLSSSLGSPMVLLCNSAQKKRKCFCMASRAHFSFGTPAAHTSQYTNTGIFLSSVSSRCWRLLFCLMKTAPLFVSCLMFQEASHFQVILASMLMVHVGSMQWCCKREVTWCFKKGLLQSRPLEDLPSCLPLLACCHIHFCCLGWSVCLPGSLLYPLNVPVRAGAAF